MKESTFSKSLAVVSIVGAVSLAGATSRSSFFDVTNVQDVFWNSSNGGLTWQIGLGATPTLQHNGVTYSITNAFGFWLLDDNDDFSATGVDQNVAWRYDQSYSGAGGVAGWVNPNKSQAILPGGNKTFNFSSITGSFENVGFHMSFTQNFANTGGLTAHVTPTATPVPEPFTMGLAGMGLAFAARRRARKAS